MKIEIKRYMLSHEGKIYKAGDIIDIKDTALVKRLVARSSGNIDFYHGNDFSDTAEDYESVELPEIDPTDSVSVKKKGKN